MKISHLWAMIVGATLMHVWIWQDGETWQARWVLEIGAGILAAWLWEMAMRLTARSRRTGRQIALD